jgi:hypothetical protein
VEVSILSKLSKYETAIELQLYRALHQLERWQATRCGAASRLPRFWMSRFGDAGRGRR